MPLGGQSKNVLEREHKTKNIYLETRKCAARKRFDDWVRERSVTLLNSDHYDEHYDNLALPRVHQRGRLIGKQAHQLVCVYTLRVFIYLLPGIFTNVTLILKPLTKSNYDLALPRVQQRSYNQFVYTRYTCSVLLAPFTSQLFVVMQRMKLTGKGTEHVQRVRHSTNSAGARLPLYIPRINIVNKNETLPCCTTKYRIDTTNVLHTQQYTYNVIM